MRNLYFLAIIPPDHLAQEIDLLRHELWYRYGAQHTLNSPPHLTLVPPFESPDRSALLSGLEAFCANEKKITISIEGFGHFGQRVLYAALELQPALNAMRDRLYIHCQKSLNLPLPSPRNYHPHISLATRDLRKARFAAAWKWLQQQQIEGSFAVNDVSLLRHSGKRWLIDHKFGFGASTKQK